MEQQPTKKDLMKQRYWHNLFIYVRNLAVGVPIAYVFSSVFLLLLGGILADIISMSIVSLLAIGVFGAAFAMPLWWDRRKEPETKREYLAMLKAEGRSYDRQIEAKTTWHSSFFWIENWALYTICILWFFATLPYCIKNAILSNPTGDTGLTFLAMWLPMVFILIVLAAFGTACNFVCWLAARKKWDEEQLYRGD